MHLVFLSTREVLYRVNTELSVEKIISNINIANGIAWSSDASLFYLANSALQTIFQCDFNNATDAISNKRIYASTITNVFPDGASVDSKYNLWSANWGGTSLSCYAVNGAERVFEMPVSHPT
ncbi:SMP-30/gluconolactonase/LRE family protein [Paraglaciecola sp.]|uniref:SMP-30/gluconolactonase/LRE family protein n=1 Tax=Pseudomonadati TaxID=3379134 RepID=UPI003557F2F9